MIQGMLAWLRLLLLLIIGLLSALLSIVFYKITPQRYWVLVVKTWAKCMLKVNGIELKIIGKPQHSPYTLQNSLVIANHLSWLDTIVLYSIYHINFIGKAEMRHWPLLSTTIKAGGTLFLNRNSKRDLLKMNQIVSSRLSDGGCIGLFPEGGVSNGKKLLPFKPALFEAAILAKSSIVPVILLFYRDDGQFAYEASYDGQNLLQTVLGTLKLKGLKIEARILDSVDASNFSSRHELAACLYQQMEQVYSEREQATPKSLSSAG